MRKHRTHEAYFEMKEALTTAFQILRRGGYIARQNFSCCGGCASYEIGQEVKAKGGDPEKALAVYYHRQGEERLRRDGRVHLMWQGDGELITNTLRAVGLNVEWDSNPDHTILVTN